MHLVQVGDNSTLLGKREIWVIRVRNMYGVFCQEQLRDPLLPNSAPEMSNRFPSEAALADTEMDPSRVNL